jgi:DNA-binding MarR family transcriptional regulator
MIVIGADTHKRWHALAAVDDGTGRVRGQREIMTDEPGHLAAVRSKSWLTRVIDRMEEAGLVERQRPPEDRRAIEVVMTPKGAEALQAARVVHRRGIQEHFAQHLDDRAFAALLDALRPVREHVRSRRPGRISGSPRGPLT